MGNSELVARSLAAVWHPCTQMKHHETYPLLPIARAEGAWIYDFDGKRYFDAISSWWVNLFGHCNPRINAALRQQLEKFEHVMLAGFTHEPVIELSERLSKLAPRGLGHCFYGSDGASSVEIALKMSFHFWRNSGQIAKTGFLSLENSYHGETLGALSITDIALFKDTYASLLRNSSTVPSPDWRFAEPGEYSLQYAMRCAEKLEAHLNAHHQEISAFIVEPLVQCAGGMAMYHPEYLKRARQLCNQYQVHLIADEIAVGFGRTGTLFACQQAGITPDFLCLSKGITGGYLPLSVVMTTNTIYQGFYHDEVSRGFLHSHSYSGNALSCRAALATLDIFEEDQVIQTNYAKSAQLTMMAKVLSQHPKVKDFRNTGMIWAFEVNNSDKNFSKNFSRAALDSGLLLRPLGNTVYFMPPYIINQQEMHFLVEKIQNLLERF
ncbi:MAG TPA: adenosylmethionine--8-amino-7-oxononanoate transaminase [Burkholderiales bacterium]|nr:adenosylmethionine--8-amino-7-oxononanoate transaminase [Burkholderiales bacterium]